MIRYKYMVISKAIINGTAKAENNGNDKYSGADGYVLKPKQKTIRKNV